MWDKTNQVELEGIVSRRSLPKYQSKNMWYSRLYIKIERESGLEDEIPVDTLYTYSFKPGEHVSIKGQMKSWNYMDNEKSHLGIYVEADMMTLLDEESGVLNTNQIALTGTICKISPARRTPKGRVIMDLMVAINHPNGRSSYLPCIVWENNIPKVQQYSIGDRIEIGARFQSRDYVKNIDGIDEIKTAYELSVHRIHRITA